MFDNIGSKIKSLAMVVCWIGIIGSVIGAIILWSTGVQTYSRYSGYTTTHPYVGLGFLVLIAGCLVSWISTWMLYAFGQLVENSDKQVEQNEEILKYLKKQNGEKVDTDKHQQTVYEKQQPAQKTKEMKEATWDKCQECGANKSELTAHLCANCAFRKD